MRQANSSGPWRLESHCEITMADVLVIAMVLDGTNGIDKGKLYCTVT